MLATALAAGSAQAQTWDAGAGSSNWITGTNWAGDVEPTASGQVVINNGALAFQPVLNATRTVDTVVISAGSLTIGAAGILTATNEVSVSGTGRLAGQGTVNANVRATTGTITGDLNINGLVDLSSGARGIPPSTVLLSLFTLSSFNRLMINGNAALAGDLVIDLTNFSEALGNVGGTGSATFELINFGSRTAGSTFDNLRTVGQSDDRTALIYTDTGVSLQIRSAVPEPATWTAMIAGFAAVGVGCRRRRAQCLKARMA